MNSMIDQLDLLAEAQIDVENYYLYADKYLRLTGSKIPGGKWRTMLKWSTKVSNACLEDEDKVISHVRHIENLARTSASNFNAMQAEFDANAKQDLTKFDCEAMYPKPIQHKVNPAELVTGALKEGMAIFN
jgi:hypothetical protein